MITQWMMADIEQLRDQGLYRRLRVMSSPQGREVIVDGKRALNFCSNNYLGLADDPHIVDAAAGAMREYGFGAGASRLVSGHMPPHQELEADIAKLKSASSCLVFNSGYAANCGIIPALYGRRDIIFSDKLNHASIVDGAMLSRAEFKRYPHADMQALEEGLKKEGPYRRRLIVTDSVFSMDGDRAPLGEIVALARRYDAAVMVDEAHGFGVLGPHGGGLIEELDLGKHIDIQMGTLSKAAGCAGGYVCGAEALKMSLVNYARSFIYTTAMPPALAVAARCAVRMIHDAHYGGQRRRTLKENADYVRQGLKAMGWDTMHSSTCIIPILIKDPGAAMAMSDQLLEKGIFIQAIRPPTVPKDSARLRITVMATHTRSELDHLLSSMKSLG